MLATYTLSQIRAKVRTRLDDVSFDGNVIDEAINNYISDITNSHNFVFMEATATPPVLTIGSNTLSLPSDYLQMKGFRLVSPLNYFSDFTDKYLPYNDFYRAYPVPSSNTPTSPNAWTEYAQQVVFNVPADIAYTFAIDYVKSPALLVLDADVCVIPNEFIECVVDGATYRIQKRDDDYDTAGAEKSFLTPKEIQLIKRYGSGRTHGRGVVMSPSLRQRIQW